jgi:eukaryotic-like serine/threonine-protein kinase
MDSQRWRQIEDLYNAVLARTPEERSAVLDRADPEIRREVEQLLSQKGSLLDRPVWEELADNTVTMLAAGMVLGRYEIEDRLGAGGMGEVFRARDTRLGRSVAIKMSQDHFSTRFEVEARAISSLNHPHICTLYDVGPNYLVMELVEGETLATRLKRGPLPPSEVLRYGAEIAEALADAHAHGIVHRDLKPSNIMLTRHGVKVLDFGLARVTAESRVTASRVVMGTPAYMAPEQVEGLEATGATDLFSLGLVLYEMAIAKLPFPGASLGQMLSTGSSGGVPRISEESGCPPELNGLMTRLLAKGPAQRPRSAADVARELRVLANRLDAPPSEARWRPAFTVAAILVVLMAGAGAWLYHGIEQRRWAREIALPQAAKIAQNQPLAAFLLLHQAEQILPGDPQIADMEKASTQSVSVQSNPVGARVEIQDYAKPGEWFTLGTTPLKNVRVPKGYFRWKLSSPGQEDFLSAPPTADAMQFNLAGVDRKGGMVPVPGGPSVEYVDFAGVVYGDLPDYDIDKFEVTNAQYQQFVDQGGYQKKDYWREKFVKDGKDLSWEQAMEWFRDPTGRPGPSSWEAGHYPPGQGNYPVTGVSWYEAAAYAVYAGKSLPVVMQWFKAAPADLAPYAAPASNFGGKGLAPVGSSGGVGPFGTFDMAGNAREWIWTESEGSRLILGGAWGTQPYQAFDPEFLPPFDRSPMNGFRTARNKGPLSGAALAPLVRNGRDFLKEKPASDEVFQAYKSMYAYDKKSLDAKSGGIVEDTPDWTKEKITIDAGYEGQRLDMYLFLPKNVHPPYEAVLFFPSARVELMADSHNLGDMEFVDYVIRSGRALLYPIYNGTYERRRRTQASVGDIADLQLTIQQSKELRRGLDYLDTRTDIDASKIAYLGVSMGTAYGVIFTALDDRFKAIVFLDGGFFLGPPARGRDQLDFAPRVTKPVLMVNGKYDFSFSPTRSQDPLFRLLGTPPADKRHVLLDTPHDVSEQKGILSKEVLAWLDKYLGRVN